MKKRIYTASLSYRPASYFGSEDPQVMLMARVKGAAGRKVLQEALDAGDLRAIPQEISQPSLQPQARKAAGQFHPTLMGGEYLQDLGRTQLEIPRITLDSVTSDVTSVYAQQVGRRIQYRLWTNTRATPSPARPSAGRSSP